MAEMRILFYENSRLEPIAEQLKRAGHTILRRNPRFFKTDELELVGTDAVLTDRDDIRYEYTAPHVTEQGFRIKLFPGADLEAITKRVPKTTEAPESIETEPETEVMTADEAADNERAVEILHVFARNKGIKKDDVRALVAERGPFAAAAELGIDEEKLSTRLYGE